MMIRVFVNGDFSNIKFSAGEADNTYTIGTGTEVFSGTPEIKWNQVAFLKNSQQTWTHGIFFGKEVDLSNLITKEEISPIETAAYGAIQRGALGTINGQSIEEGDVTLDLSLYKIVSELPTQDIQDNKIYLVPNSASTAQKNIFDEYIYNSTDSTWELLGQYTAEIDLSAYIKTADADKRYMKLTNGGATISTSNQGSLNNFGDNGQAFNAVRDVGTKSITGKAINAASFGVKMDGTTAFSHKTYNTFNPTTGAYSGARNTAVLTFSGDSGLRYAKNTGSASDVTDDMYKYVGVIDSPDERQRCYSAKQVDDLLAQRDAEIAELKRLVAALTPTE